MIGDPSWRSRSSTTCCPPTAGDTSEGRTAADNQTVRNVYVIGPDKKIKLMIAYPMTTGRNFDEMLRVHRFLQLTAKHGSPTPVNWKQGDDVIIAGSVSERGSQEALSRRLEGSRSPTSASSRSPANRAIATRTT